MDVIVRTARRQRRSGVRTFYVSSFTRRHTEYAVQYVRRPGQRWWACACPNFFHEQAARRRHCKHIHLLRDWLGQIGGLRAARPGMTITSAPPETQQLFQDE